MTVPRFNADAIIKQIDAGTLRPMGNIVARALLEKIGFHHEIIAHYDRGAVIDRILAAEKLCIQINCLPLDQQGALRLVVSLTHPADELDWYAAEFFIDWARQQGVPEVGIGEAFGLAMNVR